MKLYILLIVVNLLLLNEIQSVFAIIKLMIKKRRLVRYLNDEYSLSGSIDTPFDDRSFFGNAVNEEAFIQSVLSHNIIYDSADVDNESERRKLYFKIKDLTKDCIEDGYILEDILGDTPPVYTVIFVTSKGREFISRFGFIGIVAEKVAPTTQLLIFFLTVISIIIGYLSGLLPFIWYKLGELSEFFLRLIL